MEESGDEDPSGKRPHVPTGNTPHKPDDKRRRSTGSVPIRGKSVKKLAFARSPANIVKKSPLTRRKPLFSPLKELKTQKKTRKQWTSTEDSALVQFIALHKDMQPTGAEWPAMKAQHKYWSEAAQFIKDTAGTDHLREASVVRQRVVNYMRQTYCNVEDAEALYGLDADFYQLSDASTNAPQSQEPSLRLDKVLVSSIKSLTQQQLHEAILNAFASVIEKKDVVLKILKEMHLSTSTLMELIGVLYQSLPFQEKMVVLDEQFVGAAIAQGIDTNPADFASISLGAMKVLQDNGKPNLIYKWSKCVFGEDGKPLMPLQRMPFGLIQYQMEFFTCTNVMQVREPEDFRSWRETMTTEFPGRFMRLFAGPMWSGRPIEDRQNPQKARVNVACASQSTQWRRDQKSTFTSKPELQTSALDALKSANPDGRFWIKLDATDLRVAVMESGRHVWNGDVDLGDGELQKLRQNYDDRFKLLDSLKIQGVSVANMRQAIPKIIDDLDTDIEFLDKGLKEASDHFHKKFQQANCPEETLKEASWEVIEFQTLLQQSQELKSRFEDVLPSLDPNRDAGRGALNLLRITVKDLASSTQKYLRNVFKKKRTPASHVMVTMLSDEKRDHKPYALPVQYLPCQSLKDQFVRDLNVKLKEEMKARDMKVAGTVTDGEFCSLRSRGETRPLHLWQIIHDARDSVGKMSKTTLLKMLELIYVAPDGKPVVSLPNPDIPDAVILELDRLRNEENLSLEDAVTNIRGHQVPAGHSPYPFRRDTRESLLDKLRSVVATCRFRANIEYWKERGADFSSHLYVPESDPVTEEERHDRGDHNHLFRRMAKSVREGKDPKLNFEAFNDALHDPESGLTYAALIGKRKQSLKDAERLLSIHVADSLRRKGHVREARHVQLMANWHEASDGRGLSQLKRAQYNYEMLNYVLDDWMPWHRENYDFSTIDINRPVDCVRGFSRETLVELTTNIESQEQRRRMNSVLGYPEHPRAGVTDDLETLFAMFHRYLGPVFTLKQFKEMWPKIVREFTKRMDKDLPFYYWTINERFTDEELPSFDECPDLDHEVDQRNHPLRLHRLRINNREDGSVLVPARAVLPARHRGTLRQRLHRPEMGAPPVPYHMRIN